ncbi:MAG: TetR family transcriptional regulator [Patulibacter sp.]|nr:TetR family transcriptional regulator [Patulibacter sp.]
MPTSADSQPPDERRPRDADATRGALLRAAQRRFVLLGYDRTTTRDIAADAGVNVALINRYFGGKQGLFEAVVEGFSELLAEAGGPAHDLVGEFLDSLGGGAWPDLGAHPLVLLLRDDGSDVRIRKLRNDALGKITDRAREAGEVEGDLDDETRVRLQLVLALFAGVVALRDVAGLEPLASTPPAALRPAIDEVVAALLRR